MKKKYRNLDELFEDVKKLKAGVFVREYVRLSLEEVGDEYKKDKDFKAFLEDRARDEWGINNGVRGCIRIGKTIKDSGNK